MFISKKRRDALLKAAYTIGFNAGVGIGVTIGKASSRGCIVGGCGSKMEQDIDRILKAKGVEL